MLPTVSAEIWATRPAITASVRQALPVTLATGVITGGAVRIVTGYEPEDGMGNGSRWLTYEDIGAALGITSESAKRLAMRHKWPRRPGNDGRALVAAPEERLQEATQGAAGDTTEGDTPVVAGDVADDARSDARALIG